PGQDGISASGLVTSRSYPPEVLLMIASHLSPRDIFSCHRICRDWYCTFNPLIWKTVTIPEKWISEANPNHFPSVEATQRYHRHIRSLTCHNPSTFRLLVQECRHLTQLEIPVGPRVPALLRQNARTLTAISLMVCTPIRNESRTLRNVLKALNECGHVDHLTLKTYTPSPDNIPLVSDNGGEEGYSTDEVGLGIMESLSKSIPQIHHMVIQNASIFEPIAQETETSTMDLSASQPFVPQLEMVQTLRLSDRHMFMGDQVRFLWHCHSRLVELTWNIDLSVSIPHHWESFIYPVFSELTSFSMTQSPLLDQDIAAILHNMPNLTRLQLCNTSIGSLSMDVILGSLLPSTPPSSSPTVTQIGLRYRLLELDIRECPNIQNSHVVRVIRTCPNLRVLKVPRVLALIFVQEFGSEQRHYRWACEDLEELYLPIQGVSSSYPPLRSHLQCMIMRRLGKLTKLKKLWVEQTRNGRFSWTRPIDLEFSLEAGLDELKDLKQLEFISVRGNLHKIREPEIEWISQHWGKHRLKEAHGLHLPFPRTNDEPAQLKAYAEQLMPHVAFTDSSERHV
ncbi:hypothetical protein BGX31_002018, partial [Mortierella sp. GBA43]